MAYDEITLRKIYDRTDGRCHICLKKLSFINYGKRGKRGAWEVDHSCPRSMNGGDRLNNLYASCIFCNRTKGTFSSKTARSWHGRTKAPLTRAKKERVKYTNARSSGGTDPIFLWALESALAQRNFELAIGLACIRLVFRRRML